MRAGPRRSLPAGYWFLVIHAEQEGIKSLPRHATNRADIENFFGTHTVSLFDFNERAIFGDDASQRKRIPGYLGYGDEAKAREGWRESSDSGTHFALELAFAAKFAEKRQEVLPGRGRLVGIRRLWRGSRRLRQGRPTLRC